MALYTENAQPEGESSSSALLEIIYGYKRTQALFVAAKLGIADILSNGSQTADELAKATNVNSRSLYHLMRLLVSMGIFSAEKNDEFKLNSMGKYLLTGTSDSLRGTILGNGDEGYQAWGNLLYGVKTGESSFDKTFKMSVYSYLKQNSETAVNFNEWMKETTREWILPLFEAYDFSEVITIVDVGGNIGTLTAFILNNNPKMQAILFDQEGVVVGANQFLEVAGVKDRCQIVGGNFFDSVPGGGDLYLLSRVLLNWDDSDAIKILKNCHQAMTAQDRLMVVDFMFPPGEISPLIGVNSLNLLAMCGTIMRTEDEFYNLLSSSGFKVTNKIETKGPISGIEAKRA
ncbi:methyltransferase [Microcoleus asticus]|uniref:Mitomycin biosynthesis 6-O-methyltransferase n=1 Tax=Microcoleus asticus IPMA8 TaxID=2563858 RepID=A0ABX2CPY0_9CYAN|nr:methyltransferase [Microcoleus asticus]NQE32469.1 Mitomycin biosynthesis 6-O-methyltransferase [Microcoleus asticus IPMA8]